jgi:hypothetical protein
MPSASKPRRPERAHLTPTQKRELKVALLREHPHLAMFDEELELLIEMYDQDKGYLKRLMKTSAAAPAVTTAPNVALTDVQVVKPGDAEYEALLAKFAAASEAAGHAQAIPQAI